MGEYRSEQAPNDVSRLINHPRCRVIGLVGLSIPHGCFTRYFSIRIVCDTIDCHERGTCCRLSQ